MIGAAEIAKALGARRCGNGWMACCPAHEDRTPSLSIGESQDGRTLLKCHAGCSQEAVQEALKVHGLWGGNICHREPQPVPRPLGRPADNDQKRTAAAFENWWAAVPAGRTLVEPYLLSRGIAVAPPPSLRFSQALKHVPCGVFLPAMIAAVQGSDRRVIAVHRTYLDPSGDRKVQVAQPRLALGPITGGAVRLARASDTLALTEGIEDALAMIQMTGHPAWAVLGTSGFKNFQPPAEVRTIVLAPDADPAGDGSIAEAAARFAGMGLRVLHLRPPEGLDWNETLLEHGERSAIREFDGGESCASATFSAFAEIVGGTLTDV